MDSPLQCPSCGNHFTPEANSPVACPRCGNAIAESLWSRMLTPRFIVRAGIGLVLGALPGALYIAMGNWIGILILVLGAFVGVAFAIGKASPANVAAGAAGVLIAYNAPRFMQDSIMEHFTGDKPNDQPPGNGESDKEPEDRLL